MENGSIINQYKIISAIGKGGMGEVFLAQDTKLNRKVALKILPPEFAEDLDRMSRFVREAQSASALNHPNILTIHEIGESGGTHFIATEFIDGKTLSDYAKANPLNYKSALEIAIQVASALDEAHSAAIVHRDIKPDNVMIRANGLAKILDFGIAKLSASSTSVSGSSEDATAIKGTSPGMIIGTANYMSPEQAKGEAVDARTDIFSFGVVLYELLAGHLPFAGESALEIISSILKDQPKPLDADVPHEITEIINKCLHKDRNERYQTVKEVLIDLKEVKLELDVQDKLERTISPNKEEQKTQMLKAVATVDESVQTATADNRNDSITIRKSSFSKFAVGALAVLLISAIGFGYWFYSRNNTKQIESIAVMPFENKSSDADTDYLSDGLAESLIYRLSQLPNLKVSPTSSVFRYKGKEMDAKKIAEELGVDAVMTGRMVKRGENLTISVELVDVRNNTSLWGEQYERKMSELLATQRDIAAEIANKLRLKLSGEGEQKLAKRYTDSDEAYQLYLKGRFHFAKRTKEDILKGIDYFQQAIKLDPNFALAYAMIAESYVTLPAYPYLSPKESFPKAKVAAMQALEIDPTIAEAHSALGAYFAIYDWNWAEAEREHKRAVELNPNSSVPHFRYGQYLTTTGRKDESIAELERALVIEPLNLNMGVNFSLAYFYARQNDKALEQAKKIYGLEPNFVTGYLSLGMAFNANGMYEDAIIFSEKLLQNDPTNQFLLQSRGCAFAKSGRRREAEAVIEKFGEIAKTEYVSSYFVASIYSALGDKDKAFAELDKAYQEHDWWFNRLKVDPQMDPLRDDPRFKDLLKRMNLPE